MKNNILNIVITFMSSFLFSQVAVGKSFLNSSGSIIEFKDDGGGLILPWVVSSATADTAGAVNGTFIFDNTARQIKLKQNNAWTTLSYDVGNPAPVQSTTETGKGVIITDDRVNPSTVATPGALILHNTSKAMVLPKVTGSNTPEKSIVNPAPGMIVYYQTKKLLAVYNGKTWSYLSLN